LNICGFDCGFDTLKTLEKADYLKSNGFKF